MRVDTILVPLDGSELAERALPLAVTLARAAGASIHVSAVIPEITLFDVAGVAAALSIELERSLSRMNSYVDQRVAELRTAGIPASGDVSIDAPAAGIMEAVRAHRADLILMSSHGRGGVARFMLGSVADALVRGADVPVLVIRAQSGQGHAVRTAMARILVPLDGSIASEAALDPAVALARRLGASLTLLMVVETPALIPSDIAQIPYYDSALLFHQHQNAGSYLERTAARVRRQGVAVLTATADGGPVAAEIAAYAVDHEFGMIVMSSHGRGGLGRLMLGSVADKVIRQSEVPVLVARTPSAIEGRPARHEDWHDALADFSARNAHRLVRIVIDSAALGVQPEVDRMALVSVDYDWHEDRISIVLQGDGGGHLTHRVTAPVTVDVMQDGGGETIRIDQRDSELTLRVVPEGPARGARRMSRAEPESAGAVLPIPRTG